MYELVKRLREEAGEWCANCCYKCGDNVCGAPDDRKKDCDVYTKLHAAGAIEELQNIANKLLAKYQEEATSVIWEYSWNIEKDIDRLNEEVRTLMVQINGMPLPEPPKEGET